MKKINKSSSYIWIAGVHSVKAALHNPMRKKKKIFVTDISIKKLDQEDLELIKSENIPLEIVRKHKIQNLFPDEFPHQNVALQAEYIFEQNLESFIKQHQKDKLTLILLDQITDPHNLGAITRSAAAFGADAICLPKATCPPMSATMVKAASGGIEHIPLFQISNLANTIDKLKKLNFWCIALDERADTAINKFDYPEKTAFIFGAEGKGLRRLTKEKCDIMLKIETEGSLTSFNVSIATSLTLYERFRT